jgi:hypothetical protein
MNRPATATAFDLDSPRAAHATPGTNVPADNLLTKLSLI